MAVGGGAQRRNVKPSKEQEPGAGHLNGMGGAGRPRESLAGEGTANLADRSRHFNKLICELALIQLPRSHLRHGWSHFAADGNQSVSVRCLGVGAFLPHQRVDLDRGWRPLRLRTWDNALRTTR
jgi:hypothetical protein